jgi:succinoglycan biosynthesis protein ExoM
MVWRQGTEIAVNLREKHHKVTSDARFEYMKATIVIPTVNRRLELERAVDGCLSQSLPGRQFEMLIVDNSRDGAQRWIRERHPERTSPNLPRVRYIHEPSPGLSSARNAGVAQANGEYIVFLDDDEEPRAPGWLAEFITVLDATGADAAFGRVIPCFESNAMRYEAYITRLFTRDLRVAAFSEVSNLRHLLGSGNSCFRVESCFPPTGIWFEERFNQTGGEDTDFIRRLTIEGRRLIWVPEASVSEYVPADRTTMQYLRARRFAQGQMRANVNLAAPKPRLDLLLGWMALGSAQFAYHVLFGLVARTFGRSEAAELHTIQAYGGLGKLLWSSRFRKRRYGVPSAGAQES